LITDALATRLGALCSPYIAPEHFAVDELQHYRTQLTHVKDKPLVLTNFLLPEVADKFGEALSRHQHWQRRYHVRQDERYSKMYLQQKDWDASPPEARVAAADYAYWPTGSAPTVDFRDLIEFCTVGPRLMAWLTIAYGAPLEINDWEVVRLRQGDRIAPHQDRGDSRILGAVLYLDPLVTPTSGGAFRLLYSDRRFEVEPAFNSLVVFPVSVDHWHEVLDWHGERAGRQCLTLSVRRLSGP
jgi:Rps23 Pro-64 3,4-dihydroxylase Tpa1-like proline 4-hydroxylase